MTALLFDPTLQTLATFLDDVEGLRKAGANRMRALTGTEPDEDGVIRGLGFSEDHPVVKSIATMLDSLTQIESQNIKELQKSMKKHPLGPWIKSQVGIGEKQGARLLAAVGDPYMRMQDVEYEDGSVLKAGPRTVSQLWAYCGLHVSDGEAVRRRKGQQSNWSTEAKTRAYLISTSCIKQAKSPYRKIYDDRRATTALSHPDWTPGHSHNDALRIVSKEILKNMWIESKRLHEEAALVAV